MIQLSAVIITFNEERNIARCISSLLDIADEILVVDSFSTDNTTQIAQKMGAKIVQHVFEGHVEQKNFALSQASFNHVISLDADEALSEELIKSISDAKSKWHNDGYRMKRLTNFCGQWIKHCGWYPDIKLRLFDKRKGMWGGTNPHDKFEMMQKHKLPLLRGDLLHYSYYTIEELIETTERYAQIKAKAQFQNGRRAWFLKMYLGPVVRFAQDYFFKRGFLDGYFGFVICRNNARSVFLVQKYLRNLYH